MTRTLPPGSNQIAKAQSWRSRHLLAGAGLSLTHFSRAAKQRDALDNLIEILRTSTIKASPRMILSRRPVVCFFDVALSDLGRLLTHPNRHRYQPFGIALDKSYAFKLGARPVIYMPLDEAAQMLPAAELWRVVRLQLDGRKTVDWTFEREWRLPGDLVFEPGHAVALVEDWQDAETIYETFGGHPPCAGVLPLKSILSQPS